jgi:ribonuclease P protein component
MSTSPTKPFPKNEHLKKTADIRAVFRKGKAVSGRGAKLFFLKNGLSYNRAAFTFARKFGNAVQRNRARRLGRESYRHLRAKLSPGWDLVLLFYPDKDAKFDRRFAQIQSLFEKTKLVIGKQ